MSSQNDFQFDLIETFTSAILCGELLVIVEGKDDRKIYKRLAEQIGVDVQVRPVEEFANCGPGCTSVVEAIRSLQFKLAEREDNIKFVLGIIDRDIRPFRNELPTHLKGLFVTKYYSIETYFATRPNLSRLINEFTYTVSTDLDEVILDFVEALFNQSLVDLYYISLEALKQACVPGYSAVVGYSDKVGDVFKEVSKYLSGGGKGYTLSQIEPKKSELDIFASSFNLSVEDIKYITKGKWYLYFFADCALQQIKHLSEKCSRAEIRQCQSCKAGKEQNCYFKLISRNPKIDDLYQRLLSFIDLQECEDIIEAFNRLYRKPSEIS